MKRITGLFVIFFNCICLMNASGQAPRNLLWKTPVYTVYSDSVVQGAYVAKAFSAKELVSNYQSPANLFQSTKIAFKFSINGKDNEMQPGMDHHMNVLDGVTETPLISIGTRMNDTKDRGDTYLQPDTKLKIRVDMNAVLNDFKTKGYFTTYKGDKIYKEDFKGLYVAGNTLPMIWDFDNLHNKEGLELTDADGDGIYETTIVLNARKDEKQTDASWKLSKDISAYPQYHSDDVLANAIYNLSLEEMVKAVEPDSTFRTGKEWAGVWTRDISYSIILSMAHLQPMVAKHSLMKKVNKKKKIIQDTGTGGAYPCSTDRMIWATAAWEIYKATGDEDWLKQAYVIIKNSVNDDMHNAYDMATGMVKGESSFLDWREQTYPKWMQPADIFESENLGTNAVHYNANKVLAQMATILHKPADVARYNANAARIKAGINKYLWMVDKGYYAQYLYGRNFKTVSPRAEALGEALCVLFGIADANRESVIAKTPVTDYGISCIYPQIPGIAPYHNNAVWPFVQSYWALASARAGNERSVMESIASVYRPAALFLTNKENYVADNGDFAGTVINSSNMLWSLSGNLALVQKLLFGIEFQPEKLLFHPFVPEALKGNRSLTNFTYRNAVLNIYIEGFGNTISSFTVDGKATDDHSVAAVLKGKHTIRIKLADTFSTGGDINKVENTVSPATPLTSISGDNITWLPVPGALKYTVLKDGQEIETIHETTYPIRSNDCNEYQVIAVDEKGIGSFASEPLTIDHCENTVKVEVETRADKAALPYKGYSGAGFVEISDSVNRSIIIPVKVEESGTYAISFRYANGNGPVNTENKCAIRTIKADDRVLGTVVFPQRGKDEWSNWGFSNALHATLSRGQHWITIYFDGENENMNGLINQAMLDYLQVVKIK